MDDERIEWQGHPSQWRNLWWFVACVLLLPIPWALWRAAVTRNTVYTLTDQRLKFTRGVFTKLTDDLELYRVRDTKFQQDFFERMCGLGEIIRGWGRNFIAASRARPWRVLLASAFVILRGLTVWPALIFGDSLMRTVAVVHAILITGTLAVAYSQAGSSFVRALAWPMSSIMLLVLFAKSLWLCYTRRLTWRGGAVELKSHPLPPPVPVRE